MQERNGIPKFDLAEQIMAEQRKNVSVKRKGPVKTVEPPKRQPKVETISRATRSQPVSVGQEQVIVEIVARDIERLCRCSA
ncbi:MAG: hypothetical protein U9Q07_12440 [Planctomycetota bacterium]|nr:hypothetical protein [Planctomycetota bacterium]